MYHTRKATVQLDKVYALLGMSSGDPSAAGLSADYKKPWKEVFRRLINFSLSDQISVHTWDKKEVAVIEGKGCVLSEVYSVERDNTRDERQTVGITWKNRPGHFDTKETPNSVVNFQASAKPILVGDAVCFLRGASNPMIIRPCNGYSAIVMITAPLTDASQLKGSELLEILGSITTFPQDLLLVWDWGISESQSQDEDDYEHLISSREVSKCPMAECQCQYYLEKTTRSWNFGLLLNGMEKDKEAEKSLRKAVEHFETVSRLVADLEVTSSDNGPWRELHNERLNELVNLLTEDKSGFALLACAAENGYESVVRLLLDKGANLEVKDREYGQTPLAWAAENGHELVVQLLLDKGAEIEAEDSAHQTPLSWAVESRCESIIRLLLDKGAAVEGNSNSDRTPLSWAAENGHESIVQLLLDKGAFVNNVYDRSYRTPLSWAAGNGHKLVVQLLLDKGAEIDSADTSHDTPLTWAVNNGHESVVQLLLDKGVDVLAHRMWGYTAGMRASENGHTAVVKLLDSYR